uniref:NADH dehydrogenase [ubiquinone] 1 beta subcomplex subunit 8, mitochondrial isoform X1 n=1 Tax=Pristiophorus japonicus TaxID=55135 RepID=UPI00398F4FBB
MMALSGCWIRSLTRGLKRNLQAAGGSACARAASGLSKDMLPGPYPRTPEERAIAAKKYNMRVEDYEPYPDDGMGRMAQEHARRAKNFLHEEVEKLVTVIEEKWLELDIGKSGPSKVSPKEMRKRWNLVAEKFSAGVNTARSGSQCKKKWHDVGQVVSKKLAHNKRERTRTGGGPPNLHQLTPLEQRVAALLTRTGRKRMSSAQAGPTPEEDDTPQDPEDPDACAPDQGGWGEEGSMEMCAQENADRDIDQDITLPEPSISSSATVHGFTPSEVAGPSDGREMHLGTPSPPPSQPVPHTGGVPLDRPTARGRRSQPVSPEWQPSAEVNQVFSLGEETNALTRSLVVAASGVRDEVTTLSGEISALRREVRAGISEGVQTMADAMRELVSAIRAQRPETQMPLPLHSTHQPPVRPKPGP